MKNLFKFGFLALALSLTVVACTSETKSGGTDTVGTDTVVTADTTVVDTVVKTDTTVVDSTAKH